VAVARGKPGQVGDNTRLQGTRLLHIGETVAGGIASMLVDTAHAINPLLGADYVRYLVPEQQRDQLAGIAEGQIETFRGGRRGPVALWHFARAAHDAIRRHRPDIVHLHGTFAGAIVRPLLALRRRRPGVVYCAHGWSFLMDTSCLKRGLYIAIERLLTHCTDAVINISRFEHEQALKAGFRADRLELIPNAVRPLATGGETPVAGFEMPEDRLNLLFVGRYDRQKGLDLLERAMTHVRRTDVLLHVVGAPVLAQPEADRRASTDRIRYYGWMPRAQLAWFYRNADVLVVPSRWEGFGLVVAEAMQYGLPAIVSNRGALPELVAEGQSGFVFDPHTPHDLDRCLDGLTRERLRACGEAARAHYLADYTMDRLASQMIGLYEAVLARRGGHGRGVQLPHTA